MAAQKALISTVILLAAFVAVAIGYGSLFEPFEPIYTEAQEKCLVELKGPLPQQHRWKCVSPYPDGEFRFGDMCEYYLILYKCLEDAFLNSSRACDAGIQKSIWESTVLQYEAIFSTDESLLSVPECHCVLEFFQKKSNKELSTMTAKQCSDYKPLEECINGMRENCIPIFYDYQQPHDYQPCGDFLTLYKCYEKQFQNVTSCNDDMRKPFWEKEKRSLNYIGIESEIRQTCQAAIQFLEERIRIANTLNCTVLLSQYKRYDEQFQNEANCDTEMHFLTKYFWSNEKLLLNEQNRQCQNVLQFIDEKIRNVDQECNKNAAIAFGTENTVVGVSAIVTIFLKNMAVFDLMSCL